MDWQGIGAEGGRRSRRYDKDHMERQVEGWVPARGASEFWVLVRRIQE